jgi:LmbE family N-acetylglucosaminyl deacetylase|tara:strand:+ start:5350 stop:5985 length:636 start_codon:yes stop_codon:yes gene_type:complete
MKFLEFNRVLCLAPHPDDIEYSLSGTIIKYKDTKFDLLCLTQGGDCDVTTSDSRLHEVKNSWEVSKSSNYSLFFTRYKFLKELNEDQWINYIETSFTNVRNYDAIILPSTKDSHFEHRLVSNFGWPLSRIKDISLVEYRSPSTLSSWVPNLFVDINKEYKTKLKMLSKFESQLHRSYFQEEVIKGFHIDFQCSKKDLKLVEQFNLKQLFLK